MAYMLPDFPGKHSMSERQLQIIWHLVRGSSDKRIADALAISKGTVGTHVQRIYVKLVPKAPESRKRVFLIRLIYQLDLLDELIELGAHDETLAKHAA